MRVLLVEILMKGDLHDPASEAEIKEAMLLIHPSWKIAKNRDGLWTHPIRGLFCGLCSLQEVLATHGAQGPQKWSRGGIKPIAESARPYV